MSAKVRIEVDLDEKGAVRGVRNLDESFEQVNSEVKHLKQNSSGTFGGMAGDMFKGMIAADLLMRGISVLIDGVKRLAVGFTDFVEASVFGTAKTQDEIAKLSRSLGVPTELLSELRLSAELSGTSIDGVGTGLRILARNAQEAAAGTGTAKDAFRDLGVSVRDASGEVKDQKTLLYELAERFATMENGGKKTALAMDVFGRSGAELIPLLNSGRDGLQEMADKAHQLGIVFDAETAAKAEHFNDQLTILNHAVEGAKFQLGNQLIPVLDSLVTEFTGSEDAQKQFNDAVHAGVGLAILSAQALSTAGWAVGKFGSGLLYYAGLYAELRGVLTGSDFLKQTGEMAVEASKGLDTLSEALGKSAENFEKTFADFQAGKLAPAASDAGRKSGQQGGEAFNEGFEAAMKAIPIYEYFEGLQFPDLSGVIQGKLSGQGDMIWRDLIGVPTPDEIEQGTQAAIEAFDVVAADAGSQIRDIALNAKHDLVTETGPIWRDWLGIPTPEEVEWEMRNISEAMVTEIQRTASSIQEYKQVTRTVSACKVRE